MTKFTQEEQTILLEAFTFLWKSDFADGFAEHLDLSDEVLDDLYQKAMEELGEKAAESSIFNDAPWMIPLGDEQLGGTGDYTLCPMCLKRQITWEALWLVGGCKECMESEEEE